MYITLRIFLTVLFINAACITHSQSDWHLSKNENGIKVYTAANASSKFKSIKVEAVLPGTIQKLVAILMNVDNNVNWVYNTKHTHLIKKHSEDDILYYAETALPWPLSNRDMAIRMQFIRPVPDSLKVIATGMPDATPRKKGLVRIPVFNGLWQVKNTGSNQISIHYVLTMEPGGSIPAGVSNMFISKGPLQSFNNLARLLKK